jgi:3-hydroxyacyl-CoA dehydrogenase / enoyl-CoA hydratase / 3-hydroxybutyryl-CoA epimerase
MPPFPRLKEFRTELTADRILHIVFDMPGRSMNVFSNAAIHEILSLAIWLRDSDVRGAVVRSGKSTAFCAGADLGELGNAYDMIMAAPREQRHALAVEHFAPIGRAFRALETAGKPVAAAVQGLALGGGCELALGCHYRVLANTPQTALGLPESLVGLLPGGGGTQRLPRLVGLQAAMPILLEGARLSVERAVEVGAAHEVVEAGREMEAAERWIRSDPDPRQPWDRADYDPPTRKTVSAFVSDVRRRILEETRGHYPAPLAILDCVERGVPLPMDEGMAQEIDIFGHLIQRPEPRNMIQTLFLGRLDYEKRRRSDSLPGNLATVRSDVAAALARQASCHNDAADAACRNAGFTKPIVSEVSGSIPVEAAAGEGLESAGLWFEQPASEEERTGARLLAAAALAVSAHAKDMNEADQRVTDYAIVTELGFPGYTGGPFSLLRYLGGDRINKLLSV